jgi:SAM-dependent methyltransferase
MAGKERRPVKARDEIAGAHSWWYDVRGFLTQCFAYNSSPGKQLRFFGRNFGPKHLEIACGTAMFLALMLKWRSLHHMDSVSVTAIDHAESMLVGAHWRFKGNPDVEIRRADAAALPFADNSFDTANIANSVHCFPDVGGALRDALRVLKPGGSLAANVLLYPEGKGLLAWIANRINAWSAMKGILVTPYHRDDIRSRLLEAGFEIASETVSGNCYNVLLRKPL